MQLQPYLRSRTRHPEFLWQMVVGILLVGAAIAYLVQGDPQPDLPELAGKMRELGEQFAYAQQLEELAAAGKWWELWWEIPRTMWLWFSPGPFVLALLTGACWFAVLLQSGQPHRSGGIRWYLVPIAVGLGVLSVWPTLFSIYWQEQQWGLIDTKELAGGLKFYILGVGLREEVSKLLLFLPLAPWIVRRGSEREALLVGGCVGLGFALEENIGYLSDAGETAGRFLTANFLHISLTGLAALAFCRAVWNPRERGPESATILLMVVIVHGVYDALILLPDLHGLAFTNIVVFILIAYQFFRELRTWWSPPGESISLTATFMVSMAIIVSATLIYLSAQIGMRPALSEALIPAVSLGTLIYMFLREMPESIIDV